MRKNDNSTVAPKQTLTSIAERIRTHLKRMEADPEINKRSPKYNTISYWNSGSRASGNRVSICYISYQGSIKVKKADALTYLNWLDSGNNGQHWEALQVKADEIAGGTR